MHLLVFPPPILYGGMIITGDVFSSTLVDWRVSAFGGLGSGWINAGAALVIFARLVIPAGILRIPVFSSPVALFSQESRFLFLRNFLGTPSGILSVPGLRT